MAKFTNSFVTEESILGFSIAGGNKKQEKHLKPADKSFITESSIQDEVSVMGFGGSRVLEGRIVARKDARGNKTPLSNLGD